MCSSSDWLYFLLFFFSSPQRVHFLFYLFFSIDICSLLFVEALSEIPASLAQDFEEKSIVSSDVMSELLSSPNSLQRF
jgi:hypothetical protein